MLRFLLLLSLLFSSLVFVSGQVPIQRLLDQVLVTYNRVYTQWLPTPELYPSWAYPNATKWTTANSRTSVDFNLGFLPGQLWHLYSRRGTTQLLQQATTATLPLRHIASMTNTHDVGFVMVTSFGLAHRLTGNETYLEVLRQAAISLSTRYSPIVQCTRSWNSDTGFLVIIDNMMNLELLFYAGRATNNATLSDMAFRHANRTMNEHIRANDSTWHVVEYNEKDGSVIRKYTSQGYADWSTWSRGQAWGIYGFTVAYRYTRYLPFLETAQRLAGYFIAHLNQGGDYVPYWDFLSPYETSYQPRDTSAAAIFSSALVELSSYVGATQREYYLQVVENELGNLTSSQHHYYAPHEPNVQLPASLLNATRGPYHTTSTAPYNGAFATVRHNTERETERQTDLDRSLFRGV